MSSSNDTLTREQWRTVLDDTDHPTFGELVRTVEENNAITGDAEDLVEQAAGDGGSLTVDAEASGMFDVYQLGEEFTEADTAESTNDLNLHSATEDRDVLVNNGDDHVDAEQTTEEAAPEDGTPGCEAGTTGSRKAASGGSWTEANFAKPEIGVYPPELNNARVWMGAVGKTAFAPWGDRDHPEADADEDARWKWGLEANYAVGETVDDWVEKDPRLTGRAFIQREEDQHAFVDGDDVRCPKTGEVHPAFFAILQQLGATYADVSTSGAGVHAHYKGDLPIEGKEQAAFEIDTEPWGENDDPPTVEVYANTHLAVTKGEHIPGTPLEVNKWDADVLRVILQANGYEDKAPVEHDTDHDRLDGYEPTTTAPDEKAGDIRDVYAAIERLEPRDLPLRTSRTGEDSTGWTTWDPSYRSSSSGKSLHYNREGAFHDHKEGEAFGVLSLFAAERGIITDPWDRLKGSDWFDAVEQARKEGAPIPEPPEGDNAEPVAPIALAKLDRLAGVDRERAARKRGLSIPTTRDARERLRNAIFREVRAGNTAVLDAPTALGKSYTVATEPWVRRSDVTGDAPVVQLCPTRDARDEAAEAAAESSATGAVLRGRKEACPLARGDHDPTEDPDAEDAPDTVVTIDGLPASSWFDLMCDKKGLPFSTAHALAAERMDQNHDSLPCQADGDCQAITQWEGLPRNDNGDPAVDVIFATHQFAFVPSLRTHTNLIFDEQPDFRIQFAEGGGEGAETGRVRSMVAAYLKEIDAPVTNWEAFVMLAQNSSTGTDAAAEQDALAHALDNGAEPPTQWFFEHPDAHALAADLTKAIWKALRWGETDKNGRRSASVYHEPPRLDADTEGYTAGTWLSVVIDNDNSIRSVRASPDLSQARSVIGLDAHPSMPLWQLNVDEAITADAVLDPTERRLWRRYERGLTVAQIGEGARPRSGDKATEWMNNDRVRAVLERLRDHYGSGFKTALSTVQTERQLRDLLGEVAGGVDADNTMHYGEEKSRNDFADEDAGYVYGCMDPGDDMILDALAELGLDAEPVIVETEDGEQKREKGRTFEGPDAESAAAVLASVRENHVAQAAGRYARNADDPESRAVVYLHTNAAPTGFVDYEVGGVEWLASDLQREIIDDLTERGSTTTADLADAVGCSKEHARKTLGRLVDNGVVECQQGAGDYGADVYHNVGADASVVDLGETTNNALCSSNRWSLAILDRHAPSDAGSTAPNAFVGVGTDSQQATTDGPPPE